MLYVYLSLLSDLCMSLCTLKSKKVVHVSWEWTHGIHTGRQFSTVYFRSLVLRPMHSRIYVYDISKSDLVMSTLIKFLFFLPATCSFVCLPVWFVYIHSCMATLFSGLSVSCCINRERGYLLPTWAWKISCQCFKWMLQLPSGQKWKKYDQMLLFIALHYWGYTSLEVTKVGEDCSSLSASSLQQSSNQGLPVLHLGWSAPLRVSFDLQWRVSSVWLHIFKP